MKCSDERNIQILIEVLKANKINRVIVSPGTTNASFVASLQDDPFFSIYSAPEERSAAYMACGMAAESGKPVVLSCTGATSSRNYMPGLTEAYYRKLPVLAVTSSRRNAYIGHNMHQVTDRTLIPNDVANLSVQMPVVLDSVGEWQCTIAANKAVQELYRRGGGPIHINMETEYSKETVNQYKKVRIIRRYTYGDKLPEITAGKIVIFIGNHLPFTQKLTEAIDSFCDHHNAIVMCDHTSNYHGKYRVFSSILSIQKVKTEISQADLMIHIGEVSSVDLNVEIQKVWRVSPDGEMKDTFYKLENVFEMEECYFFQQYASVNVQSNSFFEKSRNEYDKVVNMLPDNLPFSSTWIASVTVNKLPINSVLHLGIRNSLKTWNYFDTPESVTEFSNTGGFGIDGSISSLLGAALSSPQKIFYLVVGDLAFFYDINVFGNRHFPNNIRIILVNNALGYEMRGQYTLGHKIAVSHNVSDKDYICAAGHYGGNNSTVVKSYVESFGCYYLRATTKDEYKTILNDIISVNQLDKPLVVEAIVTDTDEDMAFEILSNILEDNTLKIKKAVRTIVGEKGYKALRKLVD